MRLHYLRCRFAGGRLAFQLEPTASRQKPIHHSVALKGLEAKTLIEPLAGPKPVPRSPEPEQRKNMDSGDA